MLSSIARRPCLALLATLCLLLLAVHPVAAFSSSSSAMSYCRCSCFGANSTIIPLYRPANPDNPCLTCTRQFCLEQKLAACVGAQNPEEDPDTATGSGSDVEARCFQRDSPKSHFIVISFLVITSILLGIAGLKQYGIDLQAMSARMGLRGMLTELLHWAQNRRRRGRSSYAAMST
ncbi:hypothetical protein JCM10908_004023 [Rhodotorula pacifica]|uniref:uncharacterized protein n=1 Tax=Rhodotorula pacifica TaxID=1495444 RepID=UPI00317AE00F